MDVENGVVERRYVKKREKVLLPDTTKTLMHCQTEESEKRWKEERVWRRSRRE